MQVFHADDGTEADNPTCKAEDGTPISQQEAASQQALEKAATLLGKASISCHSVIFLMQPAIA